MGEGLIAYIIVGYILTTMIFSWAEYDRCNCPFQSILFVDSPDLIPYSFLITMLFWPIIIPAIFVLGAKVNQYNRRHRHASNG